LCKRRFAKHGELRKGWNPVGSASLRSAAKGALAVAGGAASRGG